MKSRCQYEFDPEQSLDTDTENVYLEKTWKCPHEPYESTEFCIFHLTPSERREQNIKSETVATELEEILTSEGEKNKQLIGAHFGDVRLDRRIIDATDNHRVDLRHATVDGEFSIKAGTLEVGVDLRGADLCSVDFTGSTLSECLFNGMTLDEEFRAIGTTFRSDVDFSNVQFEDTVVLDEARFNADTCLQDAQFKETASFDGAEFQGDANLLDDDACFERAQFKERASFVKAEFRYADFIDCSFSGEANFDETTFSGDAEFRNATFATAASFRGVTFEGDADVLIHDADFGGVQFIGEADFEHATFGAVTFSDAIFEADVTFNDADFESDASFSNVTFDSDCEFIEARFRSDADFSAVSIEGTATYTGVEFHGGDNSDDDDVTFANARISGAIDFQDATFRFANFTSLTVGSGCFVDTVFTDDAKFDECCFERELVMDEARFKSDTSFANGIFKGTVSLCGVEFDGHHNADNEDVTFAGAAFKDEINCSYCEFGKADFSNVEFDQVNFSDAYFNEEVTFEESVFNKVALFEEARFKSDTSFAKTTFNDYAQFRGAEFHGRDNVDDDDVTFVDAIFESDANFHSAEFRYANFSQMVIKGQANFTETTFTEDGDFDNVTFGDSITFDEARFKSDTSFANSTVSGDASFRGVEFEGGANVTDDDISFAAATFSQSLDCTGGEFGYTDFANTTIAGPAFFTEVTFTEQAIFDFSEFGDTIEFDEARFHSDSSFDEIQVEGTASFCGAEFHRGANIKEDDLSMVDAYFGDAVDFNGARFRYVSMENSIIAGEADFDKTVFNRDAVFSHVEFGSCVSFEEARFRDDASFTAVSFTGEASFSGAEFQGGDNLQNDDVTFESSLFEDEVDFGHVEFEYANFDSIRVVGEAIFEATIFGDKSSFKTSNFEDTLRFEEATFEDDTTFKNIECEGAANFYGVEFEGGLSENDDVSFKKAAFADEIDFQDIECDAFGFEHVTVAGEADFTSSQFGTISVDNTEFKDPVDMSFCQFGGAVTFVETEFRAIVNMDEIRIEGDACFANAEFESGVSFRGAEFLGDAHTIDDADFEAAVFGDTADFEKSEFRYGNFAGTEFRGNAIFVETTFTDGTSFKRAEFDASALFAGSVFADEADFSSTVFGDTAHFDEVQFKSDTTFADGTFKADTTFEASEFEGSSNRHNDDANFESASFMGEADFTDVAFRYSNFTNTLFAEDPWFEGITVEDYSIFRPKPADSEDTIIHLEKALLRGGILGQPESGDIFYDLTGGTVGEVTLDDTHCEFPLFDYFRFADTVFEEFDFTSHKAHLAENNWIIHEFAAQAERVSGGSSAIENPATLENTYLKAKNAAADFGDRKAAAEFFIKEMVFRRKKNWDIAKGNAVGSIAEVSIANRLRSLGKWAGNHILYQTCGYGERLWRVLYISGAVILFWGLIYTIIPQGIEAGKARGVESIAQLATPEGLIILGRNIYFSTATFITLEYVGGSPAGSMARWLASLEAFSGALLIALVVFVLGRRVAW